MTTEEKDKIFNDPDYISSKRYEYSLRNFLRQHDHGVPDSMIASLLKISTEEVSRHYNKAVLTLRKHMGNH